MNYCRLIHYSHPKLLTVSFVNCKCVNEEHNDLGTVECSTDYELFFTSPLEDKRG